MPKVHAPNIVQDLTDLSAASNSLMQQHLIQCNLEDDWFSLFENVAVKISKAKNKKELRSVNLVPTILSFIQPESDKKKEDELQEDVSRAHIHGSKQNATVIIEKISSDSVDSGFCKSTVDVNKTPCLPNESHQQETGLEADEVAIIDHGSAETVMTSVDNSAEANKGVSINTSTEASKMTSIDNDAEPKSENCIYHSTRARRSSKLAVSKQSSVTITNKVSKGECSEDVQENPAITTPEKKKSLIKDVINSQYENNYNQTPKTSKDSLKSCYVTQVIDKKFKSVCNSIDESIKISDKNPSSAGGCKSNRREGTSKQTKEVAELNLTTKGTKVLKGSNISRNAAVVSQKSAIIHNGNNISVMSSQKNVQPVIQPSLRNIVLNAAQVNFMKKEEERLKELKMKEEKANENVQKSKTARQMRIEENKRKRQEKMEQAELKRQKLEKEKELLLKKHYKPEASSSALKPTKTTEKRKYDDVEETTETKHRAKREREDIVKKLENQKINIDTPSELCGTKAVIKIENRSNELTEKHLKQAHSSANETFVMSKATPPSAPLKSKFNENNMKTPVNSSSKEEFTSYEMTPIQDNSDSEEESHKDRSKKIPAWASGMLLKTALYNQHHEARNPEEIFGSIIESPDLEKIFRKKRQHYNKRTSSRIWDSTIIEEDEKDLRASKRSKLLEMRERLISCE